MSWGKFYYYYILVLLTLNRIVGQAILEGWVIGHRVAGTQWCIYQLLHKYFNPTVIQKTFTTGQFSNSQLYIYPQNIMVRCLLFVCVWKVIFELSTNTWVCQCQFLWVYATYFLINVRNPKMCKFMQLCFFNHQPLLCVKRLKCNNTWQILL